MFPDIFVSSKLEFFDFQLCFYKVNSTKFNYLNNFMFIYCLQLCVGMYPACGMCMCGQLTQCRTRLSLTGAQKMFDTLYLSPTLILSTIPNHSHVTR